MPDDCNGDIASRDRGKRHRHRDLVQCDDIAERSQAIDHKADQGKRVDELGHDARRAERGRFERDLPGDAEHYGSGEADIIDCHRLAAHAGSRALTDWRPVCGTLGAAWITDLTTDCGFRLAVR